MDPSGQVFYRRETGNAPADLAFARQRFLLRTGSRTRSEQNTFVSYDTHNCSCWRRKTLW